MKKLIFFSIIILTLACSHKNVTAPKLDKKMPVVYPVTDSAKVIMGNIIE